MPCLHVATPPDVHQKLTSRCWDRKKPWPRSGKDAGGETGLERERNVLLPPKRLASGCWCQRLMTANSRLLSSHMQPKHLSSQSDHLCLLNIRQSARQAAISALSYSLQRNKEAPVKSHVAINGNTLDPQPVYSCFMGHWSIFPASLLDHWAVYQCTGWMDLQHDWFIIDCSGEGEALYIQTYSGSGHVTPSHQSILLMQLLNRRFNEEKNSILW